MNKIIVVLLLGYGLRAQEAVTPPASGFPDLDRYRAAHIAVYFDDYGQLARYRQANAALKTPAPQGNAVVFFGDSITDSWELDAFFPNKGYINRGISGQTTSQMLLRFRQDVVNLQPKITVILAGTNDIAGNTGPISNQDVEANFSSMFELARAHGIQVVFASILPVHNYNSRSQEFFASRPLDRIAALNRWLEAYSSEHDAVYLDYFHAMVDEHGRLKRELSDDGLHPNHAGYVIMAPLADKAIERSLREH